ncbi:MAG: hypothetical protein ABI629_09595, partial [bacterium]
MTRWLPLVFVLLFVGVGFVWRAWLQQRRFGHSGIVVFRSGRWDQHLREAALLGLIGLLAVQAVWAAVDAPLLSTLRLPIGGGALATLLGSGLAFGGIALMVR